MPNRTGSDRRPDPVAGECVESGGEIYSRRPLERHWRGRLRRSATSVHSPMVRVPPVEFEKILSTIISIGHCADDNPPLSWIFRIESMSAPPCQFAPVHPRIRYQPNRGLDR